MEKQRERSMLRAVELYYFEGLTQAAISERLGCTRWTVGRLLQEADQKGIVQVSVHHPQARLHQLELDLVDKYDLRYARVVPAAKSAKATLKSVAVAAADLLTDIRPRPHTVGIAYGRTVGAVARAVPESWEHGTTVVQISAAPAPIHDALVAGTVRLLARRSGGEGKTLPSTPVLKTKKELDAASSENSECLVAAAEAGVIIYSPGNVDTSTILLKDPGLTSEEVAEILQSDAIAIVGNRLVDHRGQAAHPDLDSRTLGLTLEEIKASPISIAVGAGADKVGAFRAILKAELSNAVVIDREIARALLATEQ